MKPMIKNEKDILTPTVAAPSDGVPPEIVDKYYYGHRIAVSYDDAGKPIYSQIPLKQEDFLDPEEGDHFVQGTRHEQDVDDIKSIFRYIHQNNSSMKVYSDLKIDWGIVELSNPAPDVSVIPNVIDPNEPRSSFFVPDEGTRPQFMLEMVSPRYVKPDYEDKVNIYQQAGVEEYIIVDSGLRPWRDTIQYTVRGYRLQGGQYLEIQPNAQGWIYSAINDVWVGTTEAHDRFLVIDPQTDEEILSDEQRAQAEASARIEAEERAEEAEERAQAEASARIQAEERAAEAEERAQTEALARTQSEQRRREAEAELARLREQLSQGGLSDQS